MKNNKKNFHFYPQVHKQKIFHWFLVMCHVFKCHHWEDNTGLSFLPCITPSCYQSSPVFGWNRFTDKLLEEAETMQYRIKLAHGEEAFWKLCDPWIKGCTHRGQFCHSSGAVWFLAKLLKGSFPLSASWQGLTSLRANWKLWSKLSQNFKYHIYFKNFPVFHSTFLHLGNKKHSSHYHKMLQVHTLTYNWENETKKVSQFY